MNDQRGINCPYCGKTLNKVPESKTKCRYCNNFIYVRTRPRDLVRVLVTLEGAKIIDEDRKVLMLEQEAIETAKRMEDSRAWFIRDLKSWKESGVVQEVKVITSGRYNVCEFCASRAGKIISINDARVGENVPPFRSCQNFSTTGCCCGVRPVVDTTIKI